jgi:uncharacterized protein (TIGR02757 family)
MKSEDSLKKTLDRFYNEYDFKQRVAHDPIEFPHRYLDPEDIEVAGFVAASFAYGKVDLFKPVIEQILKPGGSHPAAFFLQFSLKRDAKYVKGISYRFNKEQDILCFIYLLGQALKKWGSLKDLFYHYYKSDHDDIRIALNSFVKYFFTIDTSPVYGENLRPSGLTQLLPTPEKGSACKRMNLFLRWMVREKDIDMGIWDRISPSKLIIPLDTHISRISKCLGLTVRNASDWKTAKQITEALMKLDPEDPLKYDFALCHQGISGLCKGLKASESCLQCVFGSL